MQSPEHKESRRSAAELGRMWDALLAEGGSAGALDPADLLFVQRLHQLDDAPAPTVNQISDIWQSVVVAHPQAAPASVRSRSRDWAGELRTLLVASLGGFIAGFLLLGGGARLVMYLITVMSDPAQVGVATQESNVVGQFTVDGTLFLMMNGGIAGAAGGMAWLAMRRWLPDKGWQRLASSGLAFGLMAGSAALDNGHNPDYRRFGIFGVNVCLFTLLPVLYGIAVGPLTDWVDSRLASAGSIRSGSWLISIPVTIFACLWLTITMFSTLAVAIQAPPFAILLALSVGELVWRRFGRPLPNPGPVSYRVVGLATPCVVGLVLLIVAIQRLSGSLW